MSSGKTERRSPKRWSGRFRKRMDPRAVAFGASIGFDRKLAPYDIRASQAYAAILAKVGVLTAPEVNQIRKGLTAIGRQIARGTFPFSCELEDIHTHIDQALIRNIGPVGGKLHTGRSRNDQVATSFRLYCLDELKRLQAGLRGLEQVLVQKASRWLSVAMPGYTHLQRAQPVLLSHHLLAYVEMLNRDEARLTQARDRTAVLPLGAGALAGHPLPIDREELARSLGFQDITHNSLDAVSDRDFAVEIAAAAALISIHLSRLAEELILWSSQEFGFIKLPEAFCTGSSMMPQKINPDLPELIRGKTGRVIGNLTALLVLLKGLPLAYNKDLQEDKEPLFDTFETLLPAVTLLTALLKGVAIDRKRLAAASADSTLLATDLADQLVAEQIPFREAHEIVARVVRLAATKKIAFTELPTPTLAKIDKRLTTALLKKLSVASSIAKRRVVGGTAREQVRLEIRRHQKRLRSKP